MNKSAIAEKIIGDAEEQALKTLSAAKDKAEKTVAKANCDAELALNVTRENAEKEARILAERRATLARLDGRKIMLAAKQEIIGEAFKIAEQKLEKMDAEAYFNFVSKQIEQFAEDGDEVILSKNSPVGSDKIAELPVCKNKKLTVRKDGNFGGGVILSGAKREVDRSFSSIVADFADRGAGDAARALFGENE